MNRKISSILYGFLMAIAFLPLSTFAQATTITPITTQIPDSNSKTVVLKGKVLISTPGLFNVWFEWGASNSLGVVSPKISASSNAQDFQGTIALPSLGIPYFYKVCANQNTDSAVCGEVKTFKTGSGKLIVSTIGTEKVSKNGATLIGGVNFGDSNGGSVWFNWGLSENSLSSKTADQKLAGLGKNFTAELTGLKESTQYYFQACAKNTKESICSTTKKFGTSAGQSVIVDVGEGGFVPNSVELLAPLPGLTNINENINISQYLRIIFRITIGLTIFLAVIFLILGGIQYATTDAFSGKEEGKDKMTNAILGLLLALSAYVILNTINPKLIDFSFLQPGRVSIDGEDPNFILMDDGSTLNFSSPLPTNACPEKKDTDTCQNLLVSSRSKGKQVEATLNKKLSSMNTNLGGLKDKWQVTEAWEPIRAHKAYCHQNGTCVDINFNTDTEPTPENINAVIIAAKNSGLCAIYEVMSSTEQARFVSGGVSTKNVKNLKNWISAPHFSIYGSSC